ncbi:MAG: flagellar basal body-associated protein FliL [Paraglaciecola sp.]|uniref:flagellar basal body-associated protein FliL n=1 Tax=Paraglaciecola sp. TaxID=1920173 RepID=UPI003265284F
MGYQGSIFAQDQVRKTYAYFSLEPDIVTNFLNSNTSSRKLGYVRLSIELMLNDPEYLEAAEHHSPLLKAAIIDIFGRQPAEKVTSLTGREDIRRTCLETLRELMLRETGSEMINEVIFTKYIHHQG